jgi:uncharacterized membrane protein
MTTRRHDTLYYVKLAFLSAILAVLSVTPIGSIPLPAMKATTSHIPVIVGAILLGPGAGVFLGTVFGVMSVVRSTLFPTLTTFVFSPFLPVPGSDSGSIKALIVAFVPRILAGLLPALLFRFLKSKKVGNQVACTACGVVGSLVNSVLVLTFVYLLFGVEYAAALGSGYELLLGVLTGVLFTNGIAELIIAVIVVTAICCPILRMAEKKSK